MFVWSAVLTYFVRCLAWVVVCTYLLRALPTVPSIYYVENVLFLGVLRCSTQKLCSLSKNEYKAEKIVVYMQNIIFDVQNISFIRKHYFYMKNIFV